MAAPTGDEEQLHAALRCCLSAEGTERQQGEDALAHAAAQRPGALCLSLVRFIEASAPVASQGVPQPLLPPARLLAATQLKNLVVRQWRGKAIGTEEKHAIRSALLQQLGRAEPADAVGIAIASAIACIMRSESNRLDATVLLSLSEALHLSGSEQPGSNTQLTSHALLALLYTAKELRSMRLPAQRALGRQLGEALLPPLLERWSSLLDRLFHTQPGMLAAAIHATTLHTKVVRQLCELAPRACAAPPERLSAILSRAQGAGDTLQSFAFGLNDGGLSFEMQRIVDRLGAALGKLARAACRASDEAGVSNGAASASSSWDQAVAAAAGTLLKEAAARNEASARDTSSEPGYGRLRRAREDRCSAFVAQSAELLSEFFCLPSEHQAQERWVDRVAAATGEVGVFDGGLATAGGALSSGSNGIGGGGIRSGGGPLSLSVSYPDCSS